MFPLGAREYSNYPNPGRRDAGRAFRRVPGASALCRCWVLGAGCCWLWALGATWCRVPITCT